jgi:hypothetical protein
VEVIEEKPHQRHRCERKYDHEKRKKGRDSVEKRWPWKRKERKKEMIQYEEGKVEMLGCSKQYIKNLYQLMQ